jgi:hypothetical protein
MALRTARPPQFRDARTEAALRALRQTEIEIGRVRRRAAVAVVTLSGAWIGVLAYAGLRALGVTL